MVSARIDRTYPVDIATMWSLWTDPDHLSRWFRPSLDEYGPTVATIDLRSGGAYRFEMVGTDGSVHAVVGTVVAVEEPRRLALTWRWEGTEHESLVKVTLTDLGDRTTVTIDHTRLADEADADNHTQGWDGVLESLARSI